MSEIILNFRISLDLFELATFDMNYGLQTANKTVTCCPKVALRYFVPLATKRILEVIDTLVFECQPCLPKYPRHSSSTDWHSELLVAIVRLKWSEALDYFTILGWRVLSAIPLLLWRSTQYHHGRRLSSGGQPKLQISSWPHWQVNTIILFLYKLQFTTFG